MPNAKAKTATTTEAKTARKPKLTAAQKAANAKARAEKRAAEAQALTKRINAERTTAASVFAQLDKASVSIPVKPLSAFRKTYKRDVTAHAIGRKPSLRQAAAILVCAAGNGKKPVNGTKINRQFDMRGATYAIENGALSDAIASGLVTYDAEAEALTIRNADELASLAGSAGVKI